MSDFLKTQPAEEAPMLAWPVVCGPDVAARTRALEFHEGRLIVEVPDQTWQRQLSAFTPRYIAGFEEIIGPVVKKVEFQVSGKRPTPTNERREP